MNHLSTQRKYNEESNRFASINSTITYGLFALYIIIILFTGDNLRTSVSIPMDVSLIAVCLVAILINMTIFIRKKNSKGLHKIAVYTYLLIYGLTFGFLGYEYMQFTVFAILVVNILFYNKKHMLFISGVATVINVGHLIRTYYSVQSELPLFWYEATSFKTTLIKFIFVLLVIVLICRTISRGTAFNEDSIGTIVDQQIYQHKIFEEMLSTSEVIQKYTNTAKLKIDELSMTTNNMHESIDSISKQSEITVEHIQEQLAMTQNIQMNIEQTVENSKNIVDLASNSSDNISRSFRILRKLKEQADTIQGANKDVVDSLEQLQINSREVKSIADIIISISNQTNLLALNASIESARAGEAGTGFAVVASEIGKLAKDTKQSISRILEISNNLNSNAEISANAVQSTIKTTTNQERLIIQVLESFNRIEENMKKLSIDINDIDNKIDNLAKSNDVIVESISNISSISEEIAMNSKDAADTSDANLRGQKQVEEYITQVQEATRSLEKYSN